jgi:hypothetical protein
MKRKPDMPQKLRVIQGGAQRTSYYGSMRVVAAPKSDPPFDVDAVVYEEDTFLVLSADTTNTPVIEEHPMRLMTRLIETRPEAPGSIRIKGRKRPYQILAIVHDVDRDPTWREEWVMQALEKVLKEAQKRKFRALALQPLGTVHGKMKEASFMKLLLSALKSTPVPQLKRLWLIVAPGNAGNAIALFQKAKARYPS